MINSTEVSGPVRSRRRIVMSEAKEHLYYIDILRIISVLAVIIAHANHDVVNRCYFSVMTFTTISGAMMLTRDKIDIKKLYKKSIARIATAFLIWSSVYSVIMHVVLPIADGQPIRLKTMLTTIVEGNYHLWYCYMIAGLFIVTPCIKAVISSSGELGLYLLAVSFVFSIFIPALQKIRIFEWTGSVTESIGLAGLRFLFYYLLGYYLIRHDFTDKAKRIIYTAGIPIAVSYFFLPDNPFMPVLEAGLVAWLFVLMRYKAIIRNEGVQRVLYTLGNAVFLVYLMHDLYNILFSRIFTDITIRGYGLKKAAFTAILSFAVSVLIKRIRGLSSIVG